MLDALSALLLSADDARRPAPAVLFVLCRRHAPAACMAILASRVEAALSEGEGPAELKGAPSLAAAQRPGAQAAAAATARALRCRAAQLLLELCEAASPRDVAALASAIEPAALRERLRLELARFVSERQWRSEQLQGAMLEALQAVTPDSGERGEGGEGGERGEGGEGGGAWGSGTQAQAQAQAQAGAGADAAHVEALVGPPLQPAEWEDAALAEGRLLFMLIRSLQEACPQLPLRPAQLRPPDDAGRAAYARAHAFFEECVSEVEVCWLGRAQLVHFAPPMAASHLPPSFEEELLRALLRHATPQQRAAELLLQQARGSPLQYPCDRGCIPI